METKKQALSFEAAVAEAEYRANRYADGYASRGLDAPVNKKGPIETRRIAFADGFLRALELVRSGELIVH